MNETGVTINNGVVIGNFVPFSDVSHWFAYHRVSSKKQHEDRGLIEISEFCKARNIKLDRDVFVDKQTGKNFNRERYIVLKEDVLRPGDHIVLTELDRLGRNKVEILRELRYFKEHSIIVHILELPTTLIEFKFDNELNKLLFETIQNMLIELYATLAQTELEKKEKRTREGIAAMKARGEWDRYGRPHAVTKEQFAETFEKVLQGVLRPCDAMKQMNISSPTYYRNKKEYEKNKGEKAS